MSEVGLPFRCYPGLTSSVANVYDDKSDGAKFYPATNMVEDRVTQPAHTTAHTRNKVQSWWLTAICIKIRCRLLACRDTGRQTTT